MRMFKTLPLALILLIAAPVAHAAGDAEVTELRDTMHNLIELLVQEGVLTRARADALIRRAQRRAAAAGGGTPAGGGGPGPAPVVRVP